MIDKATWAGAIPQVNGIAPRIRVGRTRWFNLLWLLPIGFVLLLVVSLFLLIVQPSSVGRGGR